MSGALSEPTPTVAGHYETHAPGLLDLARQIGVGGLSPRHIGSTRFSGRARKVSVSMPEQLAEAVQQRVGRGEFSQYVTEAVTRQLELDLLGELATLLEEDHGPVDEALLARATSSSLDVIGRDLK